MLAATFFLGALLGWERAAAQTGPVFLAIPSPSTRPATSPITRAEAGRAIAAEFRHRGLREAAAPAADDLELPGTLRAPLDRTLRVSSICWDEVSQRFQFRVECDASGPCLPFLVLVKRSAAGSGAAGDAADPSCQLASLPAAGRAAAPGSRQKALPFALRAGDPATAVFLAGRLRMTAGVICLTPGRDGEVIRVRTADGHILRGRIAGPALVEALPQAGVNGERF
jgi:hypothetical protein